MYAEEEDSLLFRNLFFSTLEGRTNTQHGQPPITEKSRAQRFHYQSVGKTSHERWAKSDTANGQDGSQKEENAVEQKDDERQRLFLRRTRLRMLQR